MKHAETKDGTTWLDVREFSKKQQKNPVTIRIWCRTGFLVELGFVIERDVTGHWKIGVPESHPAHAQFS